MTRTSCEEFADRIVDYVDGELPAEEAQIVARHLSECPRCRQTGNNLERSLGLAKVIWEDNLGTTTAAKPSVRSIIVRNLYVKLALAAVIILAVVLGLAEFLGPGGKSGVAWAEVLERTERAPTVVFDVTEEYSYPEGRKVVLRIKTCRSAEYGDKSEVYCEGQLITIHYWLPRQKVAYQVRPDRKQYARTDLSEGEAAWGSQMDPRSWLKETLSSGAYTKLLGRTTINGKAAEGVECKLGEAAGQDRIRRLWVDVQTSLPVRIENEELHMFEGQMRPQKWVLENFEWDAQLDESLFEPNIPADYTPRPREEL